MITALDASPDLLDEGERAFTAAIREHGWFRTAVSADSEGPGFSYTTGFWLGASQPELIVFGLKSDTVHDVLWDLYRDAKVGRSLPVGVRIDDLFESPAYAFPVGARHYADYLGWSRWFYGSDDFPCLQIVWPDRAGLFPWQIGFDLAFERTQPDLSERGWERSLIR